MLQHYAWMKEIWILIVIRRWWLMMWPMMIHNSRITPIHNAGQHIQTRLDHITSLLKYHSFIQSIDWVRLCIEIRTAMIVQGDIMSRRPMKNQTNSNFVPMRQVTMFAMLDIIHFRGLVFLSLISSLSWPDCASHPQPWFHTKTSPPHPPFLSLADYNIGNQSTYELHSIWFLYPTSPTTPPIGKQVLCVLNKLLLNDECDTWSNINQPTFRPFEHPVRVIVIHDSNRW